MLNLHLTIAKDAQMLKFSSCIFHIVITISEYHVTQQVPNLAMKIFNHEDFSREDLYINSQLAWRGVHQ